MRRRAMTAGGGARLRVAALVLAGLAALLAPAGAVAQAFDPGRPGPHAVGRHEVDGGTRALGVGLPHSVELLAELTYPVDRSGAPARGRRPLVLFLHGAHASCYRGQQSTSGAWPCPRGWRPFPSYRGYRYVTDLLASQGYVTVSISGDGVNGQEDQATADGGNAARGALVDQHLRLIAAAGARLARGARGRSPYPRAIARHIDLDRVMAVGHSRGGEGVAYAQLRALTTPAPYRIRALGAMASTNGSQLLVPHTPHVVLLPQCDGDVFDLEGQLYVDTPRLIPADRALRSAVFMPHANHNFLNTMWTPGESITPQEDDASVYDRTTGSCRAGARLTPAAEQRLARSYVAAAAALWLRGDARALRFLDGRGATIPSAGRARARVAATGGDARVLQHRWSTRVEATGGMRARACKALPCAERIGWNSAETPHWQEIVNIPGTPFARALQIDWRRPGVAWTALDRPADLRAGGSLAARIAVAIRGTSAGARVGLGIRDRRGRTAIVPVPRGQVVRLSNADIERKLWGEQAQVPVAALAARAPGIDLGRVTHVGVAGLAGSGSMFVLDLWHRRPRVVDPGGRAVPQISPTLRFRRVAGGYEIRTGARVLGPTPRTPIAARLTVLGIDGDSDDSLRPVSVLVRIPAGRRSTTVRAFRRGPRQTNLVATLLPLRGAVVRDMLLRVPLLVPTSAGGASRDDADAPTTAGGASRAASGVRTRAP